MDYLASPALLGVIMIAVTLGAWTLGRSQASAARAVHGSERNGTAPQPRQEGRPVRSAVMPPCEVAAPVQRQALAERYRALEQSVSLNDLHAEVSAYRHQEQIFASFAADMVRLDRLHLAARHDSSCPGTSGGVVESRSTCGCQNISAGGRDGAAIGPKRAVQLSPDFAFLTRE